MKTLDYTTHESGAVVPTAKVELATGREFYVCNPMPDLAEAMEAGEPFTAHSIIGMAPIEVIVNPAHVAAIDAVKS
jgi:hypothetical protein